MTPMESLLSAIDNAKPILLPVPGKRNRSSSPTQMSIESILDNDRPIKRYCQQLPISPPPQSPPMLPEIQKTKVICYHGAVAQKSYGSEKRFLCPPPIVKTTNKIDSNISMSVVCESNMLLNQSSMLDENNKGTFKYLYITNSTKIKKFNLNLNVSSQNFISSSISIISKPSKKISKTRNITTNCLFSNSLVSLFNRINSQTVRTKYLNVDNNQLCAKNSIWSPFEIVILNQPQSHHIVNVPITYNTEIVLRDVETGISSPPLIIKKVDKGQVVNHQSNGIISQMQKIALQLSSSANLPDPLYLNSNGQLMNPNESSNNSNTWTNFIPSTKKLVPSSIDSNNEPQYQEQEFINDYLCWTIVGISKFEYTMNQHDLLSPPPSPPHHF